VSDREKNGGLEKYSLESYNDKRVYVHASYSKLWNIECP